jgi:hypothetical protein
VVSYLNFVCQAAKVVLRVGMWRYVSYLLSEQMLQCEVS